MLSAKVKKLIKSSYHNIRDELPNFHPRKEQNYLVAEIAKTLAGEYNRQRRIAVVEAGTGIGKSLAYSLGAIPLALSTGKKVCISTATVALQEQLVNKDLPFFRQTTGLQFDFGLVKGRQRYVCLSKLELLADEQAAPQQSLWHFKPQTEQIKRVKALWQAWRDNSWDGERDSLAEPVDDQLWNEIASDKHSCNRQLASHHSCPFHKSREMIDKLDVLIVNHSLLLADLELGGGKIIPAPDEMYYVLDEAHHLPVTAREFSSASASIHGAIDWLSKLDQTGVKLSQQLKSTAAINPGIALADAVNELVHELKLVGAWLQANPKLLDNDDKRHRFVDGVLPDSLVAQAENCQGASKTALKHLNKLNNLLLEAVKDGELPAYRAEPLLAETGFMLQRMENLNKLWEMLAQPRPKNGPPMVRWIELLEGSRTDYLFNASPIEIGFLLEDLLWSKAIGVTLCSATLLALNSFDSFRFAAGLGVNDGTQYIKLQSPFDFQNNAELCLPTMRHEPSASEFTDELADKLPALLDKQDATLVLFSSYWQMNQVAKRLRDKHKLSLLVQGEASRQALLTLHKDKCDGKQPSILFGTGSFSEGLDLPGHYLTNLVITKLPFAVPTSPVEQAHAEYIKSKGGNPFLVLAVPDASKKLIQACGRLLRNEKDQGRITILDRRLVTKRYGKSLLDSLPPYKLTIEH